MQAYTIAGVKVKQGEGFIFTGYGGGDVWQVRPCVAGERIHGVAPTDIDDMNLYDIFVRGDGPCYVMLSENVTKNAALTPDGAGGFKNKGVSDNFAGLALLDGLSGTFCPAFLCA